MPRGEALDRAAGGISRMAVTHLHRLCFSGGLGWTRDAPRSRWASFLPLHWGPVSLLGLAPRTMQLPPPPSTCPSWSPATIPEGSPSPLESPGGEQPKPAHLTCKSRHPGSHPSSPSHRCSGAEMSVWSGARSEMRGRSQWTGLSLDRSTALQILDLPQPRRSLPAHGPSEHCPGHFCA